MKTNRRDFLVQAAITPLAVSHLLKSQSKGATSFAVPSRASSSITKKQLAEIQPELQNDFRYLLEWLKKTGWIEFIRQTFGVNLVLDSTELEIELFKQLTDPAKKQGFEDFGGMRTIEPGEPSMSLLYHALASAKVKLPSNLGDPESQDNYPTLEHLDILENYIYGLKKLDLGKLQKQSHVLAVFAYEYRPAVKTPHEQYADLVFSRTGLARIGDKKMNYDRVLRCHTNMPIEAKEEKHIAVTPARYGLFLAQKVKLNKEVESNELELLTVEPRDYERDFLLPIRKIFNGDTLLDGAQFIFTEHHRNEKLRRLAMDRRIEMPDVFNKERPPFKRISCTTVSEKFPDHDSDMVALNPKGSSVLLSAIPAKLICEAWQGKERLRFKVPAKSGSSLTSSNRRYTTLKLQDRESDNARDYIITDYFFRRQRPTRFSAPRNTPLFVHIRTEVSEDGHYPTQLGAETPDFEEKINSSYWAALYEDRICDGCVAIRFVKPKTGSSAYAICKDFFDDCLPAFSLVTAPDFFPLVDSTDLECFDINQRGQNYDSNFLEGGIERLSTARKRPNPAIKIPGTNNVAFPDVRYKNKQSSIKTLVYDTVTAVVSAPTKSRPKLSTCENLGKGSESAVTSFLPDTASFVFAPGWDVTYSGTASRKISEQEIFLATYGLGSPFPEDIKLCAAANGMWPAASPDAARTFQGSIDEVPIGILARRVPPTSVPLMDSEIGLHPWSPAVKEYGCLSTFGWDGEQGPFLEKQDNKVIVNFTDLGRADYVQNSLDGKFDMSQLRRLGSNELILRMQGLRRCVKKIESSIVAYSKLWLVSAEKVEDWKKGARGFGIPSNLVGNNNQWATTPQPQVTGAGYLYVFVKTGKREIKFSDSDKKRRYQTCDKLYVCQVAEDHLSVCQLPKKGQEITWKTRAILVE